MFNKFSRWIMNQVESTQNNYKNAWDDIDIYQPLEGIVQQVEDRKNKEKLIKIQKQKEELEKNFVSNMKYISNYIVYQIQKGEKEFNWRGDGWYRRENDALEPYFNRIIDFWAKKGIGVKVCGPDTDRYLRFNLSKNQDEIKAWKEQKDNRQIVYGLPGCP